MRICTMALVPVCYPQANLDQKRRLDRSVDYRLADGMKSSLKGTKLACMRGRHVGVT